MMNAYSYPLSESVPLVQPRPQALADQHRLRPNFAVRAEQWLFALAIIGVAMMGGGLLAQLSG